MTGKTKIGIVGATGYVGAEMVACLAGHPGFSLTYLSSQSYVGQKYSDIYPSLKGLVDMECAPFDTELIATACDVVVTALPHGISSQSVPLLLDKGLRVLDHSGDFRYKNSSAYEDAYRLKHPRTDLLAKAVYGLPEFYRQEIKEADLVANPGCYPTCSILALAPLLKSKIIKSEGIIISATSGISGAGRTSSLPFQYCEAAENYKAYAVSGHRHTSEMEEVLDELGGVKTNLLFTPHLAPMKRGMLATIYADTKDGVSPDKIQEIYNEYYENEFFIRMLPQGQSPQTSSVESSNFVDLSFWLDEKSGKLIILSALDNLGKGAARQAIQSLNIMFGFDETSGLI